MDATALEARLTRIEQENARIEKENAELRREIDSLRTTALVKMEEASLPRRDLLKGAAYALGAVSLSLMGTRPAEATTGTMIYGSSNNAGTSATDLFSTASETLRVTNGIQNQTNHFQGTALFALTAGGNALRVHVSGSNSVGNGLYATAAGTGHCVQAVKTTEFGNAVLAFQNHPTTFYGAIAGVTKGAGPGVYGRGEGSGQGVWGQIADAAKSQSAVLGTTEGTGAAIEGNSIRGRGGVFKGLKAQIRLVASTATTKPATGTRGDLFVDKSGRLWYCKTGGSTTGWKQLA
jgi:hypothetical protein